MALMKLALMIGKVFLGGLTRRQVALGVVLGLAIGMTPGINLTTVILVALLLLMNTNVPLGILAAVVGKLLSVLLAPVTFWLGYTLMHALGLIVLVRAMANTPVLALLGWDIYCLLGAIPLVIVLAVVVTKLTGKCVGKFGITGKAAPLFSKGRLAAAVVLLGVLAVIGSLLLGLLVNVGIKQGIQAANGAEVNVRSASLSPFRGRLTINGLQVTDPQRPMHNTVQADRIVADVSISALLTKRMEVDLVSSKQMVLDGKRSSRGDVYKDVEEVPEEDETIWDKLGDRAAYIEKIKQIAEKLDKLKDYLEKEDPAEQDDPAEQRERLKKQAEATGYLSLSAKDFLTKRPTWLIRLAEIQLDPAGPIPPFILKGENLSSHPSLIRPDKAKLRVEADPDAFKDAIKEGAKKGLDAIGKYLPGGKDEDETDKPAEDGEEKKGVLDKLFGK